MTFSQRVYTTCCKRFNSVLKRDANETVGTRLGKRFLNVVFIGFKTTLVFRKHLKPTESLTQTCYTFANCYGFGVLKTFSRTRFHNVFLWPFANALIPYMHQTPSGWKSAWKTFPQRRLFRFQNHFYLQKTPPKRLPSVPKTHKTCRMPRPNVLCVRKM